MQILSLENIWTSQCLLSRFPDLIKVPDESLCLLPVSSCMLLMTGSGWKAASGAVSIPSLPLMMAECPWMQPAVTAPQLFRTPKTVTEVWGLRYSSPHRFICAVYTYFSDPKSRRGTQMSPYYLERRPPNKGHSHDSPSIQK